MREEYLFGPTPSNDENANGRMGLGRCGWGMYYGDVMEGLRYLGIR